MKPVDDQIRRLLEASFTLETLERYPRHVAVSRDGCIALLEPGAPGLRMLGQPGWRIGDAIGVLIEKEGRQVFQAKADILEATPERLEILQRFRMALDEILLPQG